MRRATIRTVHDSDGRSRSDHGNGYDDHGRAEGGDDDRGNGFDHVGGTDDDDGKTDDTDCDGATAERIAASLVPDNTDEMETTVAGDAIVTRIERETTGGLAATVDDYVVNLDLATRVVQQTNDRLAGVTRDGSPAPQINPQRHNE